jgi:hypothetical protein
MKSGNLNFLEPFGPLQACNGTELPFLLVPICSESDLHHVTVKIKFVRNFSQIDYSIIGATCTHKIQLYVSTSVSGRKSLTVWLPPAALVKVKAVLVIRHACLSATWRRTNSESSQFMSCLVMLRYDRHVKLYILYIVGCVGVSLWRNEPGSLEVLVVREAEVPGREQVCSF